MTAPKVTPYAPIDPDLGVDELRLLARRYQVERDVARAGERAATAMVLDTAARANEALAAYKVEVETAMRAAFDGAAQVAARPVLTRYQAVTIACALCPGGDINEQADAVLAAVGTLWGNGVEEARPVLTEAAAREAVEAILYVPGRSPFAMVGPLVALLVGRPAAGVRAPEALTEEAARAMVVEAWNETTGHGGGIYELHEAFTALLLRVAGPVTAEQASMAAAFDAAKEGAA